MLFRIWFNSFNFNAIRFEYEWTIIVIQGCSTMETEIYFLASNSGCKCHCQQFHSFHRWNEADIILFTKVLQHYYCCPLIFLCNSAFYCHWADQSQSARRSKPKVKHILFSSIMYFGSLFSCAFYLLSFAVSWNPMRRWQ